MNEDGDRESVTEVLFRKNLNARNALAEAARRIADRLERESERPPPNDPPPDESIH